MPNMGVIMPDLGIDVNGIATAVKRREQLRVREPRLLLQGSPPSGKLLIPLERPAVSERQRLERRDVRVAEGARLESVCRGNSTEGSNPSLSAILSIHHGKSIFSQQMQASRDRK